MKYMANNGRGGKIKELPRDEKPHMSDLKGNFFFIAIGSNYSVRFHKFAAASQNNKKNIPR